MANGPFSNSGLTGGRGGGSAPRSAGGGDRIQQAMSNSGTTGGRGANKTGPAVKGAHMNGKSNSSGRKTGELGKLS